MNANGVLFRQHMVGEIMPADKARTDFTEVHIEKMVEIFNDIFHGRKEKIKSKFLEKGNIREEDGITLLSLFRNEMLRKNTVRLNGTHTTGEVDLYLGESIENAEETFDVKCSWSKITFDKVRLKKINPVYKWQGVSSMELTKAKKHTIAYCLVNGTAKHIMDEKRKAGWDYGTDPEFLESIPEYIEECRQIERNHIFDLAAFRKENPGFDFHSDLSKWTYDLPIEQRVHLIVIPRSETEIQKMKDRIDECRQWMNENLFKSPTPVTVAA